MPESRVIRVWVQVACASLSPAAMTRSSRIVVCLLAPHGLAREPRPRPALRRPARAPHGGQVVEHARWAAGRRHEVGRRVDGDRELTSTYADASTSGSRSSPIPNRCEPGAVTMDFGRQRRGDILAALGDAPPTGGNYTPMAQTLDVAPPATRPCSTRRAEPPHPDHRRLAVVRPLRRVDPLHAGRRRCSDFATWASPCT